MNADSQQDFREMWESFRMFTLIYRLLAYVRAFISVKERTVSSIKLNDEASSEKSSKCILKCLRNSGMPLS